MAIIGDLHTHWDAVDLAQFDQADYDLLFFTGDLGGGTPDSCLRVARVMASLNQPTLVMPGNNDTIDIEALAAELAHQNGLNELMSLASASTESFNPIALCGYSHHEVHTNDKMIGVIAARPHSMGGPTLSFPDYMQATYGIGSLDESRDRLIELVDASDAEQLIFLGHNGPLGLGDHASAMWGCDFKADGGDWGDADLAAAIDHARAKGKQVLAVIAGHMHLVTKQGELRPWQQVQDDTLYINAARVPRIFSSKDNVYRHHVVVSIDASGVEAEEVLLAEYA